MMNTPFNFSRADDRIVYVKALAVADLPPDVAEQVGSLETIFGVYRANGEQVALVADRDMAFHLARQHDMDPVTVH